MMKLELYQEVSLKVDLPEYNLKQGDLATLIDYVPHPKDGEDGCVLEVFNALGESLLVLTVPQSAIESLRADTVLAIRRLESMD